MDQVPPPVRIPVSTGPWPTGINSLVDPIFTPDSSLVWSVNTINRGGKVQTRPGLSIIHDTVHDFPRGITMFTPRGSDPILVQAIGNKIRYNPYPFVRNGWVDLGVTLNDLPTPVYFETCIYGADSQFTGDGTVNRINPYPVLFISNGSDKTIAWDGTVVRTLNPAFGETPVGGPMKWVGNRLWIADGPNLHASNLLEPSYFSEEQDFESGGFFTLPDNITGLGVTANFQSLLVYTSDTVTSIAATLLDRTQWGQTPNFQQVILSSIGCISHRSIINQFGMTWWYADGGLVSLDEALSAFRSSKIHYKDEAMARSKGNFSDDISNICLGGFGNFLMVSTPSGDLYPAHTWVMDEAINEAQDGSTPAAWASCWTGIRPVQWVTANVRGKTRVFCQSYDSRDGDTTLSSNVWEAFCRERFDFTVNSGGTSVIKPISCSMETKFLSNDASYKKFNSIKAMLSEVEGSANISLKYSPRHGGFKEVLNKDIVSNTTFVDSDQNVNNFLGSRLRENRYLRSFSDAAQSTDGDGGVEEPVNRNIDKGFLVKVDWTGALSVDNIILLMEPTKPPPLPVELDETTDRYVNSDGTSAILTTAAVVPSLLTGRQTSLVMPVSPRSPELRYTSLA